MRRSRERPHYLQDDEHSSHKIYAQPLSQTADAGLPQLPLLLAWHTESGAIALYLLGNRQQH